MLLTSHLQQPVTTFKRKESEQGWVSTHPDYGYGTNQYNIVYYVRYRCVLKLMVSIQSLLDSASHCSLNNIVFTDMMIEMQTECLLYMDVLIY